MISFRSDRIVKAAGASAAVILFFMVIPIGRASTLTTLYSFPGGDSQHPCGELVTDDAGNFYGTTEGDGWHSKNGTIFKITPEGQITTIHTFTGEADGKNPTAGIVRGGDGNFYGTVFGWMGGKPSYGAIFKLTPNGEFTTLHTFSGKDGSGPEALMQASDGNFYGTTAGGSSKLNGTIFKITPNGQFTMLHALTPQEGKRPRGPLVEGEDGNLYGAAENSSGYGMVFRVTRAGAFAVIHNLDYSEGGYPAVGLTKGPDAFYGTATDGGKSDEEPQGAGTVFRVRASGELKVLHIFGTGIGHTGFHPKARLLRASDGRFYGTTERGGAESSTDFGTIFRIAPDGTYSVVYSFQGDDGRYPRSGLIQTADGAFYGVTSKGGTADVGAFYKLTVDDTVAPESKSTDNTPESTP